jgi:tetratricopeptide (TPR) repeat protein
MWGNGMSRLLLLIFLFSAVPLVQAQADMSVPVPDEGLTQVQGISIVQGQVHYTNGEPAGSVVVSLVSLDNGSVRRTTTDPSGYYAFLNLKTGDYQYNVEINKAGYMPVRERVISCDMAPVSLFVTLIPFHEGSASGDSARGPAIPKKAQAEYQEGLSAMNHGKTAQAAAHFSKAVGICPVYFDSYLKLAATEADQHHFAQAQKMIDRALQLNRHSSLAYAYLGYVRMRQGKSGEARKQFLHAIRLSPSDWFAHLELGRILLRDKQAKAAFPHLTIAHQIHPQLPSVHLLYYDDLILLNKKSAALAELNDILARFPKAPEAPRLRQVRGALQAAIRRHH